MNKPQPPGVLLGRNDGVIVLNNAQPVSAEEAAALDRLLDALSAPPTTRPQDHDNAEDRP